MNQFQIIPVLDILGSQAVHAVKGKRTEYKPLNSDLIKTTDPMEIIEFLTENLNFNEIYIADLDSILNRKPNLSLISKISKFSSVRFMVDPGIIDIEDCLTYSKLEVDQIILGLETMKNFDLVIPKSIECFGQDNVIVSLDLFNGQILSPRQDLKKESPIKIIKILQNLGIKKIILLDLLLVGSKEGGIPPLYLEIRNKFDGGVLVGGGIKNLDDVINYKNKKFSGVLIATALYDGSINPEKLKSIEF